MEYNSSAITDEAVQQLLDFTSDVFDEHMIQDPNVRAVVARQLLADSHFVEFTQQKFDLADFLHVDSVTGKSSALEPARATLTLTVGLTNAQKSLLTENNADYQLVFRDSVVQPHALAYAQRKIDLQRLKAKVTYRTGNVIDIGGNYATHTMANSHAIHCCTLNDDAEEMHRQTQRNVLLDLGEYPAPNYCVNGVQRCDVAAEEAISLHTLPRIDPADIPSIFRQHGLKFITGVHHYDPMMDFADSGYMPDVEMHWKLDRASGLVEHFFENDSSYPYVHRLDWLQQYSHTNYFAEPDSPYVIYYSVDRLEHGILSWSMSKLEKATLGTQEIPPQYRYVSDEQFVNLAVPSFSEALGYSVSDPRAYEMKDLRAPVDLFEYVYKAGVSNDTERPDLPLTLDRIRDLVQTYNYVRPINGTSITVSKRMPAEYAADIARGIYLVIVQRSAHARLVNTTYTDVLLRIQKRWGSESFLFLAGKCFSYVAAAPFMLLAEVFDEALDIFAVHMRATIQSTRVLATAREQLPYHIISPVVMVSGIASRPYTREIFDVLSSVDAGSTQIDVERFYEIFRDELAPKHLDILEERIAEARNATKARVEDAVEQYEEFPPIVPTRESWDDAMEYVADKVPLRMSAVSPSVGPELVLEDFSLKIYESAAYYLDVGLNVVSSAQARCIELWTGTGYRTEMLESRNTATDLGMKFLRVDKGVVEQNRDATAYMVCMDPSTHELLVMGSEEPIHVPTQQNYVFVMNSFKIFNNYKMAKKLSDMARKILKPPAVRFTLVDGVPGCGKTHEIVERFRPDEIIACAVRDTADMTRKRVLSKNSDVQTSRIKTTDSFVINNVPGAKSCYIDEGLMVLPGVLNYIAFAARARNVYVFGDSAQIGFIDRGSKLGVLRYPRVEHWNNIEYRNESNRVPLDVCFLMRSFYPEERRGSIKTRSNIRRSLQLIHQPDKDNAQYKKGEAGTYVLTFLQTDKGNVLNGTGFVDAKKATNVDYDRTKAYVMSVHESQGGDFPHVSVFRLNPFTTGVFDSSPHQLVALTRHTHSFKYVTVLSPDQDSFAKLVSKGIHATEEQLDDCMAETPDWLEKKLSSVKERGF